MRPSARTATHDDAQPATDMRAPGDADSERRERESRSLALEKAYVHGTGRVSVSRSRRLIPAIDRRADVYDQLSHHFSEERYRPWPRVRLFLEQLEPGSLVCDAGTRPPARLLRRALSIDSVSGHAGARHTKRCPYKVPKTLPPRLDQLFRGRDGVLFSLYALYATSKRCSFNPINSSSQYSILR